MKLLHTADWHLGRHLESFSRHKEQAQALAELVDWAQAQQPDVVLVAGDLFDRFAASPESEDLFIRTLIGLSGNGCRPVVAIAGNHDHPTRLENLGPLASAVGIVLLTRWMSTPPAFKLPNGTCTLHTEPGFLSIGFPHLPYPLRLIATPFTNTARIGRLLPEGCSVPQAIAQHWTDLASRHFDPNGVNVLMTHFTLLGASGEEPEATQSERWVRIGGSESLSVRHIPPHTHYTALGHLHKPQTLQGASGPAVYSGSLLRYSLSESGQTKGAAMVSLTPSQPPQVEHLWHTGLQDIVYQEFESETDALQWLATHPQVYVELCMVVDDVLHTDVQNRLRAAHPHLLRISVKVRKAKPQANGTKLSEEDLDRLTPNELFAQFYAQRKGAPPSPEMQALFAEVLELKEGAAEG